MSLEFGDLVLVIGDQHVPQRTRDLPECFKELLQTDKIKIVLCTGNCGSKAALDGLQGLGHEVHCVRGESDDKTIIGRELPESLVVEVGEFKVGVISGYQILPWQSEAALLQWQRKLGCDILISGHTHEAKYFTLNNKLFLNPGSATGAAQHYDVAGLFATDFSSAATTLLASVVEKMAASKSGSKTALSSGPEENATGAGDAVLGPAPPGGAAGGGEADQKAPSKEGESAEGADVVEMNGDDGENKGDEAKKTDGETTAAAVNAEGEGELQKTSTKGSSGSATKKPEGESEPAATGTDVADSTPTTAGAAAATSEIADTSSTPGGNPPPPPPPPTVEVATSGVVEAAPAHQIEEDLAAQMAATTLNDPSLAGAAAPAVPGAPATLPAMGNSVPSFMLMAVQGSKVVVYIYKEIDGETNVDQFDYQKM
eukprot:g2546.t1